VRGQSGPLRLALVVLVALIAGAAVLVRAQDVGPAVAPEVAAAPPVAAIPAVAVPYATGPAPVRVAVAFRRAPLAGLLFDLRSGRVLWSRGAMRRAPVASLAKMMTAIVVVDLAQADELVPITP
jgi:serine-type D-Ala-D-Ala carboxypeptidase (penicillin-binding protein 5/6)